MTDPFLLRVLERVHGHLGWLAVAALLHPAILLRNPRRRAPLSVLLATAFVTIAGGLGAFVYPAYRRDLKRQIFVTAPAFGWWFERKEHLAVGVLVFAWMGCVAHLGARSFPDGPREALARIAHRCFVAAAVMGAAVGAIGVAVASYSSF